MKQAPVELTNVSTGISDAIVNGGAASGVEKVDCVGSSTKLGILAVGGGAEGI